MSVATEERVLRDVLDRVEKIESVAVTLGASDERRLTLRDVIVKELAAASPVRPRTAAEILGLTEKTVRSWVTEGVLTATTQAPRLLLDPTRLHEVWHLVQDLRQAGKTRGLLDEVHRRLADQALLDREDLAESLEQMRRGEGTVRVPRPTTAT
jgi:DNA-binding transcriptional MerR regulator